MSPDVDRAPETALNRICPYFTMFPLRFPYSLLRRYAQPGQTVLDPFCGRGTTNYAARLLGLDNVGIDSSPVAVAIAAAKVAPVTANDVMRTLDFALESVAEPSDVPEGEFWELAFSPSVLHMVCRLRDALGTNSQIPGAIALRAVILGALHGPLGKTRPSYLSNQSPRTYGPKPAYAVRFWRQMDMRPPEVNVVAVLRTRIQRYFAAERSAALGHVIHGDSRRILASPLSEKFDWIVSSPPYYGLRTYVPDQWIRHWFLGGPPQPAYDYSGQLSHRSPEVFAHELRQVWRAATMLAKPRARMIIRFGGINDRSTDPLTVAKDSLRNSGWRLQTVLPAGSASHGRRQADHFRAGRARPREEYDLWACRDYSSSRQ